jgi:hypothetical protein
MSGRNEHLWLNAVREEARQFNIRQMLKLATVTTTVTIHLYRSGIINMAGAKLGLGLASRFQRTAIRWLRSVQTTTSRYGR